MTLPAMRPYMYQMVGSDVASMPPLLLYMCSVGFEFTARGSAYLLEHKGNLVFKVL